MWHAPTALANLDVYVGTDNPLAWQTDLVTVRRIGYTRFHAILMKTPAKQENRHANHHQP
ncbi:hypothetical protein [Thiothrix caldifontis]|uniref:hypothetical protein n=1 Tax=Thiothrix caldifontis TaxID=525918 RepID=UPI001586FF1D|nr:hypothetical protein [Thiothrix caldifontis]